jgi:hypothetical protein
VNDIMLSVPVFFFSLHQQPGDTQPSIERTFVLNVTKPSWSIQKNHIKVDYGEAWYHQQQRLHHWQKVNPSIISPLIYTWSRTYKLNVRKQTTNFCKAKKRTVKTFVKQKSRQDKLLQGKKADTTNFCKAKKAKSGHYKLL